MRDTGCGFISRDSIRYVPAPKSGVPRNDPFTIRVMTATDITLAGDWAAAEGWNPGLNDAACFSTVDPDGFHIGELYGAAVSTISVVNYDAGFSFLGFYVVRPELRGRGYGLRTWHSAITHAGTRMVGLDGVVAQQDNYRKSGFVFAHRNIRYGGVPVRLPDVPTDLIDLRSIPFAAIDAYDAMVFPAPRRVFLRAWIHTPGHVGRALIRDGQLAAWGVIRPCRTGHKVGPLFADDRAAAEVVFAGLVAHTGGGQVFLDVVEPNRDGVALAEACALAPAFETARMYTGAIRPIDRSRIFGITTFELG
jgi:GNAT superfamily N-acetyltransferase